MYIQINNNVTNVCSDALMKHGVIIILKKYLNFMCKLKELLQTRCNGYKMM